MAEAGEDARADPAFYSFPRWLARQAGRKDRIGALAAAGSALDFQAPGVSVALERARDEHKLWYFAAWPGSPAAKAEAVRFARHEVDRATSCRALTPNLEPFDGDVARAVAELATVLGILSAVVSDIARATPISARVKPQLQRVDASLAALRRAAT